MTTELDRLKEFFLVDGASYEQWTPHGESTEHLQVVGCTAEVLALIAEMDRLRHANAVLQTHARERSGERGKFIEAANAAYNAKRKLAEQDDAARDENARLTERVLELETVDNARLDELDVAWKKAARLEAELKELEQWKSDALRGMQKTAEFAAGEEVLGRANRGDQLREQCSLLIVRWDGEEDDGRRLAAEDMRRVLDGEDARCLDIEELQSAAIAVGDDLTAHPESFVGQLRTKGKTT